MSLPLHVQFGTIGLAVEVGSLEARVALPSAATEPAISPPL